MIRQKAKNFDVKTTATWEEKKIGNFVTTKWKTPLPFSCPPSFGGTNLPSPEDLFLAAVATCTLTTILQLCDSLRTEPENLSVTTSAKVQFNKRINDYEFSAIFAKIKISGEKFLLERACDLIPKYCIIGKNIKPPITYDIQINQAP
ncbi:MAG: OsmC family protein [Candidatus Hodarchaeales archaeon]|jgi:uncharacterized OsmC-like protein